MDLKGSNAEIGRETGRFPADAARLDSPPSASHLRPMAAYAQLFADAPIMDRTDRHCRFSIAF